MTKTTHKPALLHESLTGLNLRPEKSYIDCTLGGGGHSLEIIKQGGKLYALDIDADAIKRTKEHFQKHCPNAFYDFKNINFSKLKQAAKEWGITKVSGILFDLGLSSDQLADGKRGFSFLKDAELDMRANLALGVKAKDLINALSKKELIYLFKTYGQETWADKIAQKIITARKLKPISTTKELADIIVRAKPQSKIHSATQVFQALRIAVNDELNNLKSTLPQAVELLETKGRLVIISFHSLEDKIVKHFIKNNKQLKNITKKPIIPSEAEITKNPRSRSAKLRIAEKI